MTAPSEWLLVIFTGAQAVGVIGAAVYAANQIRELDLQRKESVTALRVERALTLHRELTSGEVAAARDRFTTMLWNAGTTTPDSNLCAIPSFEDILLGKWREYPKTVVGGSDSVPMRDVFKVLWLFERIETARSQGMIDEHLVLSLFGYHSVWWDELLINVKDSDIHVRPLLRSLANWILQERPELQAEVMRDFGA